MSREIKFRAWDGERFLYFGLFDLDCHYHFDSCTSISEDAPIDEFTGLKDKHGVEIYEGDITNNGIIVWIDDIKESEFVGWHLQDTYEDKYGNYRIGSFWSSTNPFEVISNIHQPLKEQV